MGQNTCPAPARVSTRRPVAAGNVPRVPDIHAVSRLAKEACKTYTLLPRIVSLLHNIRFHAAAPFSFLNI
jgi:hypothetical protein